MNAGLMVRKLFSFGLSLAIITVSSMVSLASSPKTTGILTVTNRNGGEAVAFLNGTAVRSGRSIFSSSTISTEADTFAVVDLGNAGRFELAPGTSLSLTFDDSNASVVLSSGSIKALSASRGIEVTLPGGEKVAINAGETAGTANRRQDDDDDKGGAAWWLWALVFGGAAAGMIIGAVKGTNRARLGGSGTVISPTS